MEDRVVLVPLPYGEIVDRIAILGLKVERMSDARKIADAAALRDELIRRWLAIGRGAVEAQEEWPGLVEVNAELWDVEDALRICEQQGRFDAGFVELARRVYRANDRRAALKRALDLRLGSPFHEPKEHRGAT